MRIAGSANTDVIGMKKLIKVKILHLLIASLLSFSVNGWATEIITVEGTGDSQILLSRLAQAFASQQPDIQVVVPDSIGSGGGIRAVASGKAGLGRTARPLTEEETKSDLVQYLFARSPVVLAAHPSLAQLQSFPSATLVDLYSGQHQSWDAVGGPANKVYLITREPGDSSRRALEEKIPGFDKIDHAGKVFYNTPSAALAIAKHAFSAGYLPLGWAKTEKLHIIALDGVFPDEASVVSDKYPLVTPFYIVSKGPASGAAKRFVDFLFSEPAQHLMREAGVVPVGR